MYEIYITYIPIGCNPVEHKVGEMEWEAAFEMVERLKKQKWYRIDCTEYRINSITMVAK